MSSISIKQLPKVNEINSDDLLLIQTPTASNTLEFKDLIIGLENTTFAGTISTFNTEIEAISANVLTLSGSDKTNTAAIATNTANLGLSAAVIDLNVANIATNATNIATNTTNIATNTTSTDINNTNILSLSATTINSAITPEGLDVAYSSAQIFGVPIVIAGVSYNIMLSAVADA